MNAYPSLTYRDVEAALECLAAAFGLERVIFDDPDAHDESAKAAGTEVLGEPHDATGGRQRGYSARDPEGNLWLFGTSRPETEPHR